jgi:8-oxo-dGTP diphosphatase
MATVREGAAILFVNPDGEVLLRLRGDEPGLAHANKWDTIGGSVEAGEGHEQAAIRETDEEIGYELRDPVWWRDYSTIRGTTLHIYAAPLDLAAQQIVLTEGQRVEWFGLDAALGLPLVPWVRATLPEFMASEVYRGLLSGFRR